MSQRDQDTEQPITLINVFEVPDDQVTDFVEQWRQRAAVMAGKPGFLGARLHRAVTPQARFPVVNIAHWASREAWQAATADAEFQQQLRTATADLPITAYPAAYQVVVEFPGDAETSS
ncbi:MAG TPA: antibiotic biosynthesis monooxygenase family protein [Pseudonocardiaceae bacterium]|jgi:heme-degrading monooxygenase HmoA|nr:antibiotic biosynthesis monooxygenase family protein [Pseudonocardiaceae bacterium]